MLLKKIFPEIGKVLINANILVKFDVKPTEALLLFNEIKI